MTQEGSEGQVQQNSSQSQQGGSDAVPAAVTAKFEEIFGKTGGDAKAEGSIGGGKKTPKQTVDAQIRATQQKQRKAQQRDAFMGREDDHDEDDGAGGDSEESAQNRSQPLKRGTANGEAKQNGTQSSSAKQQSQASEEEGDGRGDEGQQSQQGAAEGDDDPPTLNPILRHAARRAGWSPEEADEFFETNPDKAEAYFQKMHDSFNSVSAQFAQLGQQAAPQQGASAQQQPGRQPQQQAQQQSQSGDPVEDLISAMYGNKADQLAKDYNPEFVEEFARKPAKWLHENVVAPMRQMQAFYQQQQVHMVAQEAKSFTKGLEADFADLYGTQKTRTKEQQTTLNDVYGQADIIMAGARQRGVSMSVSEALDRAHNIVASKFLEQQTRKRLVAQVQKRSSQLTQRPTQRKNGTAQNGAGQKSDKAALEALTNRMQELGVS